MPDSNESGSISPEQYQDYAAAWTELIASGDQDALTQAFQLPEVARLNFLLFSIDQVIALVAAADAHIIRARFLLMPDAAGQPRFTTTLFASDADNHRVSDYFVPAQSTQPTASARGAGQATESTQITRKVAVGWLTDWVNAPALLPALFTTGHGTMHGYNFELSTFADPLAAAQPYEGKGLFLNLGLSTPPDMPEAAQLGSLVVYISLLDSRKQGTLAGLPDGESFYDVGSACPPAPPLQSH